MLKSSVTLVAALALTGCATTPQLSSQERAYCHKMEREMGTGHMHDHAEARGMGMDPMRVTHDRCRQGMGAS